jgi:hypothetical protein
MNGGNRLGFISRSVGMGHAHAAQPDRARGRPWLPIFRVSMLLIIRRYGSTAWIASTIPSPTIDSITFIAVHDLKVCATVIPKY